MTALLDYIDAWAANDADRIAAAVAHNCIITECYGPIYRGRERVYEWATTWFRAGGVVHSWAVDDHFVAADREVAQWQFECTWAGSRSSFEGVTVSRSSAGFISELREYQTTGSLYYWEGTWR